MASTRMAHVEIYRDRTGQYRWRLFGANHEIVATGEGHSRPEDARRAFLDVSRIVSEGVFIQPYVPKRRGKK